MSMRGMVYKPYTLFFRIDVGDATVTEDKTHEGYEMSINAGGSCPIIRSKKTGKWWTVSWQELIKLAVEEGIDVLEKP